MTVKRAANPEQQARDTVRTHYESLLAKHYTWMLGDLDERVANTTEWFRAHGIIAADRQRALDLGCGSGVQSLALAALGFEVTAVDFQASLIDELANRSRTVKVTTVLADLLDVGWLPSRASRFDVVVCMGDTLAHLPSIDAVKRLLERTATKCLVPDGRLVLSFRDFSQVPAGETRLIPVRLDDPDKVMLAFTDFTQTHVRTHDIILERVGSAWQVASGMYPKLRLSKEYVVRLLRDNGMIATEEATQREMILLVAERDHRT